jgi:anaerobic selenocysteine-containing dehydrogenase
VQALLVFGSNLLVSHADSDRIRAALERVDFLAVTELFPTPTAMMADIVLPASGWLERDQIVEHAHYVAARTRLAQVGEAMSDEQILNELAARLGLDHFFGGAEASLDYKLAPIGKSWRDLQAIHYQQNRLEYRKHEKRGFPTRSGKLGLYSGFLEQLGYDPLPRYEPLRGAEQGPYILTSARSPHYFNSEGRNIDALRRKEPDPTIEIHPEAAEAERIADGDWVEVEAHGDVARFKARVTDRVARDVVCVSASWWYPELPFEESFRRSNVNRLTRNGAESPEMGSSNQRGIRCRIRPVEDDRAPLTGGAPRPAS